MYTLSLYPMPYNTIPFFVLAIALTFFGVRGYVHSRKVRAPLSFYYGVVGILLAISNYFYSLPWVFTQDDVILKITVVVGDLFYFASLLVSLRIIWYFSKKKVSFYWYVVPVVILQVVILIINYIKLPGIDFSVTSDNIAVFPVPAAVAYIFAIISTIFIAVGVVTITQVKNLKNSRQRLRLYSVGGAFAAGGLIAVYNYLFALGANNRFSTVGYIAAALLITMGAIFVSRSKTKN